MSLLLLELLKKSKNIKKKPKTTLLFYSLFYADETVDNDKVIQNKKLTSEKFRVTGKPDYILKNRFKNKYIPLEVKSREIKAMTKPLEKDVMQLATYFLLIEDNFGSKPKYGRILYKDYMFTVYNTRKLRKKILKTIKNMDNIQDGINNIKTSHTNPSYKKCLNCISRNTVCEYYKK